MHAASLPTLPRLITFTVTDGTGAVATDICPGSFYTVSVAFPEPRHVYMTAADASGLGDGVGIMNNADFDSNYLGTFW